MLSCHHGPGGRAATARRAGARLAVLLAVLGPVLGAPGNVTLWSTNTSKQAYAAAQLAAHGWGPDQFGCLNNIWVRESGRNELAGNPAYAYGIPQADPGSKVAAEGPDWLTNPQTQIRWGEDYIQSRYGTPRQAWACWQARGYYGPMLAVVPF